MAFFSRAIAVVAGLASTGLIVTGCSSSQPGAATTQLPAVEVPYAARTPVLDAALDDPAWRAAAVLPALSPSVQLDRAEQELLAPPTEVRLLWDEQYLYVRFVCHDDEIYSPFEGRDRPHYQGDVVEVFLDPAGDSRQYVELQVSPRNQIFDQIFTLTAEPVCDAQGRLPALVLDRDWWANLGWECEGLRTAAQPFKHEPAEAGWIVDMAIPAKSALRRLGRESFQPMMLRANLLRYEWTKTGSEDKSRELRAVNWSPVVHGCPHISPAAMGYLRLIATK